MFAGAFSSFSSFGPFMHGASAVGVICLFCPCTDVFLVHGRAPSLPEVSVVWWGFGDVASGSS